MISSLRIGLNGFGRIGRAFTRIAINRGSFLIKAINTSRSKPDMLAYLLKYDSVYRTFGKKIEILENGIKINGEKIASYNHKDPADIPWDKHNIDIVIDCTGIFKKREDLKKHLKASVKKIILTSPSSDKTIPHVVMGVNDKTLDFASIDIVSNASCTTNCAAVMIKVLDDALKVKQAFLASTHAYTSSQKLLDASAKKFTRARAAPLSIIPTTTGAATAVCKVINSLDNKLGAVAIRVPVPTGSLTDISCIVEKETTVKEINMMFKLAAKGNLNGILNYQEIPLVSSDYIGSPYSCTLDANYTQVLGGNFVKVFGWYDNEWGYSERLADLVERLTENI